MIQKYFLVTHALIEKEDIEGALSKRYGREVELSDVECMVFYDLKRIDWVEFYVEGTEGSVPDFDLWAGDPKFDLKTLQRSFHQILWKGLT